MLIAGHPCEVIAPRRAAHLIKGPEGELDGITLREGVLHLVEMSIDGLLSSPTVVDKTFDE